MVDTGGCMTREEWLTERRRGVGGSDAASLLNIGWGCRKKLWFDKRDTPADFPRKETKAMTLGKLLEPWFSEQYACETGRDVVAMDKPMVHESVPELRVNVDRLVFKNGNPNERGGILEIKSVGRAAFYKYVREGLPLDYVLQLQHGMLVANATWGSFAIGSRDSGEVSYWDVDRNETICKEILIEGPLFWVQVQNGPMPDALEPDDPRCGKCEYRVTCQGNALIQIETGEMPQVQELAPLVEEYIQRKALFDEAEALKDETAEELKTKLGERQAVYAGEHKIYFRPQAGRTTYKGEELVAKYNELRKLMVTLAQNSADPNDLPTLYAGFPEGKDFIGKSKPSRPLRIF